MIVMSHSAEDRSPKTLRGSVTCRNKKVALNAARESHRTLDWRFTITFVDLCKNYEGH